MKKLILAVLALTAVAVGQDVTSTDTLIAQHQRTIAAEVVRPNFRRVTRILLPGDSVRTVMWINGAPVLLWKYTVTRNPLDTANVVKGTLKLEFNDVSK